METFREFELEFDWMLKADGNSGVKYMVQKVDEWVNREGRQARARVRVRDREARFEWRCAPTLRSG